MSGSDFNRCMELIEQLDEEMKGASGEVDIEGVSPARVERFAVAASFLSALLMQSVGNIFVDGARVSIPRKRQAAAEVPAV
jgi:hypothetical protein